MINFRNYPQLTKVVIPNSVQLSTTDFTNTFVNMKNLVSTIVPDNKITNMANMYANCYNLTGSPISGNNVTNMSYTYYYCRNITGSPVCGENVTNMSSTYRGCYNITGNPICGNKVTDMSNTYVSCRKLTGSPVCGNKVTNMRSAYSDCNKITGSPVCGKNVIDMSNTYHNCNNITGNPVCGNSVVNMHNAYRNCINLTGSPACSDNVIDMSFAYYKCNRITGSPACGNNVTNMYSAYSDCTNLTGNPACGKNVTQMHEAYWGCSQLTGSPVCENNVTNMRSAYSGCRNITGFPVCGEKVTDMDHAYYRCYNLTGNPVCGNKVTNMQSAYSGCRNLIGSPACGESVINMAYAYDDCANLYGNTYFYSNNISNVCSCFNGRNASNRLNIYVHENTSSMRMALANSAYSLVGKRITWTDDTATNGYHYNTTYNIYIYPVANVAAAKEANENPTEGKVVLLESTDLDITMERFNRFGSASLGRSLGLVAGRTYEVELEDGSVYSFTAQPNYTNESANAAVYTGVGGSYKNEDQVTVTLIDTGTDTFFMCDDNQMNHQHTITIYGYASESSDASIITFTIDGTRYQAEQGMTWKQWIESVYMPYNDAYYIDSDYIYSAGNDRVVTYNTNWCYTSEIIVSGREYVFGPRWEPEF